MDDIQQMILQQIQDLKEAQIRSDENINKRLDKLEDKMDCNNCTTAKALQKHIDFSNDEKKSSWNWLQFSITSLIAIGALVVAFVHH